ncbi:hypothetical protein IFVP136_C230202 [Vibrio parahaemolyticus]
MKLLNINKLIVAFEKLRRKY